MVITGTIRSKFYCPFDLFVLCASYGFYQELDDLESLTMEDKEDVEDVKNEAKANPVPSSNAGDDDHDDDDDDKAQDEETSVPLEGVLSATKVKAIPRSIPPPGIGQKIYEIDPTLSGFRQHLDYR